MRCFLRGFQKPCSKGAGWHRHHWISRGKLRGAKEAQAYVRKNEWFFTVPMCPVHNVGRIADTKEGRRAIVKMLVAVHGEAFVGRMLTGLVDSFKVPPPEFTLEALFEGETEAGGE